MKIKQTLTLLFFASAIIGCSQHEKKEDVGIDQSSSEVTATREKLNSEIDTKTYKTTSGKSIQVLISKNGSSINDFAIVPTDFQHSQDTFKINDADPQKNTWLLDLDKNGYDELYIVTSSVGSGSYETIYGYASNQDLSITPIYIPPISENDVMKDGNFYGYMGHDSIFIEKDMLYRKFPIYLEGDPNCCPTGGEKILSYRLRAGEASWILEIVN